MDNSSLKIGYIGLGRMGKLMVPRLLENGVGVVAWNRSPEPVQEVIKVGAIGAESLEHLVLKLEQPRIIWLMLPAGEVIDEIIGKLLPNLSSGDLIIDGGNSFYQDTLKRAAELSKKGIHYMDVGVSGGVEIAQDGACLMVGGTTEDFAMMEPIFKAAAAPEGYQYLGPVGAGHFAKMVHNGIEYGMMEAIAEGAAILKNSPFDYDLREAFRIYTVRSIIESRLVGWALAELNNDPSLSNITSAIGSAGTDKRIAGEGDWTLQFAKEIGINVPVIEASMRVRDESANDPEESPNGFRNKMVSAIRGQFGHHPVKKDT